MITLKTVWMCVMGTALAGMLVCRLVMAVRHLTMAD